MPSRSGKGDAARQQMIKETCDEFKNEQGKEVEEIVKRIQAAKERSEAECMRSQKIFLDSIQKGKDEYEEFYKKCPINSEMAVNETQRRFEKFLTETNETLKKHCDLMKCKEAELTQEMAKEFFEDQIKILTKWRDEAPEQHCAMVEAILNGNDKKNAVNKALEEMATLSPLQTSQNEGNGRTEESGANVQSSSSDVHAVISSSNPSDQIGKSIKNGDAAFNDSSISSPHELTDWVDNVLDQLESRFSVMSGQVENRMKEMSERIDALESSIEELITGASAPIKE